jgi:hypothetical protein
VFSETTTSRASLRSSTDISFGKHGVTKQPSFTLTGQVALITGETIMVDGGWAIQ